MLISVLAAGILMLIGLWLGIPYSNYLHFPGTLAYVLIGAFIFFTSRGDSYVVPGEWFPSVAGLLLWTVIIYGVISVIEFVVRLEVEGRKESVSE